MPELNKAEYKAQFRLSRSSFTALCVSLDAQWVRPGQEGRPPMATDKAVAITLWRLANTVTYREVAEQFGEQRQTVQKVCRRVMELICSVHSALIRAPSTRREWEELRGQWAPTAKLANTVGAVDGTHIRMLYPPHAKRRHYQNRKKYASMNVQAIVNHRMLFIDIAVGAEGSMHDARVWRRSFVRQTFSATLPPHHYIVGDSAYPASPWLLTPYKEVVAFTVQQEQYNKAVSSTRVIVELAFGKMKCRWRCLNGLRVRDLYDADEYCFTCCVLHNWCILQNDDIMEEWMRVQSAVNALQALESQQQVDEGAGYEPTLFDLYQHHRQQQPHAPQPLPAPTIPHVHVQLDNTNQPLFDLYFTSGPDSLTEAQVKQVGLHLRDCVAATY